MSESLEAWARRTGDGLLIDRLEREKAALEALLRKWHAATDALPFPLPVIGDLRRETTELLK